MKSLESRFKIVQSDNKYALNSSLIQFNTAVKNQKFSKKTINQWFYKLVDREDYERSRKMAGILKEQAFQLSMDGKISG